MYLEIKYPNDRKRCDVVLNNNLFIEVKAVRKMRNNGVHEEFLVNIYCHLMRQIRVS
jgi:hypothetical protein